MPKYTVDTGDGREVDINYNDMGTGRPVVLIHGWPLSARSWEPQVLPLVEAGFRVISYDRRGFGDSEFPWEGYDYDTLAADLEGLLIYLDLQDVALVGFSMGGGEVVRHIAAYGATRVTRAVLASSVPPYLAKTDDNPEGAIDEATATMFMDGVRNDRAAFLETFMGMFFSAKKDKILVSEQLKNYMLQIANLASPKATLDCITSFGTTDFRPDVQKIDIPTLVIHGDSDQVVPFEASGKRSAEMISTSTLHVIEGGPHAINASHTAEFNRVLIEFLSR